MKLFALTLFAFLSFATSSFAATRYAVPSGGLSSGTCTTTGTACTLLFMESICAAGDLCLLRDGVFNDQKLLTTSAGTSGSPRVFRAENPHQAKIQRSWPPGNESQRVVNIKHSYNEVYDLVIDGLGVSSLCGIDQQGGALVGVRFARNIVQNGAGCHFSDLDEDNKVAWNWFKNFKKDGAFATSGEWWYGGSSVTDRLFQDFETYANRVTNAPWEIFNPHADLGSDPWWFSHHNIWEDVSRSVPRCTTSCPSGGQETVAQMNAGNTLRIEDSIIRESGTVGDPLTAVFGIVGGASNHQVRRNVIYDIKTDFVFKANNVQTKGALAFVIEDNTVCNLSNYGFDANVTTMIASGAVTLVGSNPGLNAGGVAQSNCDNEVTRILAEITALFASDSLSPVNNWAGPSFSSAQTATTTKIRILYLNNGFPPIQIPDYEKCTVTENGVARAVSAGAIVGTNILELTVATLTGGTNILVSCQAGAVVNSADVLGLGLNISSSAFTGRTVENTLDEVATAVLTQTNYRFYNVYTTINSELDPLAAVNTNIVVPPGARVVFVGQIDATADDPAFFGAIARYSKNSSSYTAITDSFTVDNIKAYGLSNLDPLVVANNAPITTCLAGPLGVVQGSVQRAAAAVPNVDLAEDECVALGFAVEIDRDAAIGDTYDFRLYNQNGDAFTYTQTGRVTIGGHSLRQ